VSGLVIPKLSGSVGDGAVNAPEDVRIIQDLLNKAILNGELPGFVQGPVNGKASGETTRMIAAYQNLRGIPIPRGNKSRKAVIEPESRTLMLLAKNPLADERWSEYDAVVQEEVDGYNQRLRNVPGFVDLDWRWVKAMIWTEVKAGPDSPAWAERPMQIGNPGDPGLKVIQNGLDHSDLVVPEAVRIALKSGTTGGANVRAGVAYLYHRAAYPYYKQTEIVDNPTIETSQLAAGTTLTAEASKLGTTVDEIVRQSGLDPAKLSRLQVGTTLKYRKAHKAWQISGWLAWEQAIRDYNGGGDSAYVSKVSRAYAKIASCWSR
jgi:hypothetical protein